MKGKRLTITLVLTLSFLFLMTCSTVFAYDSDPLKAEVISLNEEKTVVLAERGESAFFKFRPDTDGMYVFKSIDTEKLGLDTIGQVLAYDPKEGDLVELEYDDDGGDEGMFAVAFEAKANKDYYLQAYYYSGSSDFNKPFVVKVEKSQVKSITFDPAEPYQYEEYSSEYGYYEWNSDGERFFYYSLPGFRTGDKLTLTTDEGTKEYVYGNYDSDSCFKCEGDIIKSDDIKMDSDQYENPWSKGTNYFTVKYSGISCTVPVVIGENNVKSFSFIANTPYQFNEYDQNHGQYSKDQNNEIYFYYNVDFKAGDKVILTYKDDSNETFVCQFDSYNYRYVFVSEKSSSKRLFLGITHDQYKKHWAVGTDNYFSITCMGLTENVQVEITANSSTVSEISYTPAKPFELTENTGGHWEYNGQEEYYYYREYELRKHAGDILKVTYADGTEKKYTHDGSYRFVADDNEVIYESDVCFSSDQSTKSWSVGTDNIFKITYMGKTCTAPVTINESSIKSISYTRAKPLELKEEDNTCGYWREDEESYFYYSYDSYDDGDRLTVTTADSTKVYECKKEIVDGDYHITFVNIDVESDVIQLYELSSGDNQSYKHWVPDADNYYFVTYGGKRCEIPVTIKRSERAARKAAVKGANKLLDDVKDFSADTYTEDTYKAFEEAKATLESLIETLESTTTQIEDAIAALNDAVNNLKTKANAEEEAEKQAKQKAVDEANQLIEQAKALNAEDYTDDSFKAVDEAKTALESILADSNSTSEEIIAAKDKLASAIDALVKKQTPTPDPEPTPTPEPEPTPDPEPTPTPTPVPEDTALAVGTEATVGGSRYVVTSKTTVALKKAKNGKKVTVPASVKLSDGNTYKVTQVNAKSFTGKKIRTVTIGKNVKKLKKNAFKSSKAKKLIVKTKLLKKASVKGSLKGSKVKTIQVKVGKKKINKKFVKKYKKIFTKKNAGKKVKVK